jgi:hypothetical protein
MRRWALIAGLTGAVSSAAADRSFGTSGEAAVSWTPDGRFAVIVDTADHDNSQGPMVVDGRTGVMAEEDSGWLKAHKLVPSDASQDSPDGRARADVVLSYEKGAGAWDGDVWKRAEDSISRFNVIRDGKTFTSVAFENAFESVSPYWSPRGGRILWLVTRRSHEMDGERSYEFAVGPAGGPRLQLLANKDLLTGVVPAVQSKLEAAGFPPTWTGPAKGTRPKSIVYSSDVAKEAAKQIAALIPGGAAVEALSWKTSADVVVALGASANESKP